MYKNKQESSQDGRNYVHYEDPVAIETVSDYIICSLPQPNRPKIVVCIGTDRSTGDSLGPLTGTFLSQLNPRNLEVYGTLHQPVHAINLNETIKNIHSVYNNPFIIAIDASLGRTTSIGSFISGTGSIKPGAALNKDLPPVGDVYITGVVNVGGFMDFTVLQSTRLSMVHDMAHKLALVLQKIDRWLTYYYYNRSKSILNNNLDNLSFIKKES